MSELFLTPLVTYHTPWPGFSVTSLG